MVLHIKIINKGLAMLLSPGRLTSYFNSFELSYHTGF